MNTKCSKKLLVTFVVILILYGIYLFLRPKTNNNTKAFYSSASFQRGFALELDKELKMKEKFADDFTVYYFSLKDKNFLSAYLGWHPSFPIRITSDKKEITFNIDGWIEGLFGGYETKCFAWQENQYGLECLVDFGIEEKGPQFVHFWGYYENPDDRANALKIIKSTKKWLRKENGF